MSVQLTALPQSYMLDFRGRFAPRRKRKRDVKELERNTGRRVEGKVGEGRGEAG